MTDNMDMQALQEEMDTLLAPSERFEDALHILANQMKEDSAAWFGDGVAIDLTEKVLGLCGETGEVADIVKKIARGSITLEEARPALAEELIDVFIYWTMIIGALNVDVTKCYLMKREFNKRRFGNGGSNG